MSELVDFEGGGGRICICAVDQSLLLAQGKKRFIVDHLLTEVHT